MTKNKTIEPNVSKKIEPNASNKIEQTDIEKKEVARNQIAYTPHIKDYLDNLPTPSLTNLFGRNTAKRISISAMDQSTDTNHTRMKHLSFPAVTIGSKYLAIGSARLGKNLIKESNQLTTFIDIRGHGDRKSPFASRKSGNKTSVDFGWNMYEKIAMNPLRATGRPHPQVTRDRLIYLEIFD